MAGGRPGGGPPCASTPLAWLLSRELLNAHKDNLGTTIKFVVFNELSNARNPNNMQILYTVLQHSSELAPKVGRRRLAASCSPVPWGQLRCKPGTSTPGRGWMGVRGLVRGAGV